MARDRQGSPPPRIVRVSDRIILNLFREINLYFIYPSFLTIVIDEKALIVKLPVLPSANLWHSSFIKRTMIFGMSEHQFTLKFCFLISFKYILYSIFFLMYIEDF